MQLVTKFEYGQMVVDTYSGFQGQVTAVCFYRTGCVQYCVNVKKLKDDGTPVEGVWLDESQLKAKQRRKRRSLDSEENGGPQLNPPPVA